MVAPSTRSRWSRRMDRLMMSTRRGGGTGGVCRAGAPANTVPPRSAGGAGPGGDVRRGGAERPGHRERREAGGGAREDQGKGAGRGGVDGAAGDAPPALPDRVGGGAERRPGGGGAEPGGGGFEPAE